MTTPFEEQLKDALKKVGYLLPDSLEELEAYEKDFIQNKSLYPMPDQLNDPAYILGKGYSKPEPIRDQPCEEVQEDFLAMAARFGNHIPDNIKEQMKRDRDNAREKKQ